MVVIEWSTCSPSTPTISVRFSLNVCNLLCKVAIEKKEEARVGPFKNTEKKVFLIQKKFYSRAKLSYILCSV